MQVKIRFNGIFDMQVNDNATVGDLKSQIRQTLGLSCPELLCNGVKLEDHNTLYAYNIVNDSCILVREMFMIICWVQERKAGVTHTRPFPLVVHGHNTFGELKWMLRTAFDIDMATKKFILFEIPDFEPPDSSPLLHAGFGARCSVSVVDRQEAAT
jgi:ubiquitin C